LRSTAMLCGASNEAKGAQKGGSVSVSKTAEALPETSASVLVPPA